MRFLKEVILWPIRQQIRQEIKDFVTLELRWSVSKNLAVCVFIYLYIFFEIMVKNFICLIYFKSKGKVIPSYIKLTQM